MPKSSLKRHSVFQIAMADLVRIRFGEKSKIKKNLCIALVDKNLIIVLLLAISKAYYDVYLCINRGINWTKLCISCEQIKPSAHR